MQYCNLVNLLSFRLSLRILAAKRLLSVCMMCYDCLLGTGYGLC
jgi:hypothetical protein